MPFLLKDTIHSSLAEAIYNDILSRRSHYFYFIGRVMSWTDEDVPDTPSPSSSYEYETRNKIINVKKIPISDVAYVTRRINWASNVVFDQYDGNYTSTNQSATGKNSLKESNFYVLTDEYNVYKCLFNNGGASSNVKPTGRENVPITTEDEYVWKYLYSIPFSARNKFLSSEYMPVFRSVQDPYYSNGQISTVIIDNAGLGYSNSNTTIIVTGDGENADIEAVVNASGELEDYVIVNGGSGYTYADLQVTGSGSNANIFAVISNGDLNTLQGIVEVTSIDGAIHAVGLDEVGSGYTTATVTIDGDGTGANATAFISNTNQISKIVINAPGSGYTFAAVTITGDGTGANAYAILPPLGGHGKNAIKELNADAITLYSTINNERIHRVDVNNDYRQFGIIKNLKKFSNTTEQAFVSLLGTPCFLANVSNAGSLERDMILSTTEDTSRTFEVIEVAASNNTVLLNPVQNNYLIQGNVLTNTQIDVNFVVQEIVELPTINKFSGDLLFIDNRTQVSYSDQQVVTLRTTIKV